MRKKVLTKDCPSCDDVTINDDDKFECLWGISKEPKILVESERPMKHCKLKGDK